MDYWDHGDRLKDWDFTSAVHHNGGIDLDNVVAILATHEGVRDEEDWAWLVQLEDGYAFATGGCDYTGWD